MSHAFTLLPNGKRSKLTHPDVADPGGLSEEQESVISSQENTAFFLNGWEEEQSVFDWEEKPLRPGYECWEEASSLPDVGAPERPQRRKRCRSESLETLCETSHRIEAWVTMQKTRAHGQDPHSLPGEEEDEDMEEDDDEDSEDEISDDTDGTDTDTDTDNNDADNEDSAGGEDGEWDDDNESDATSDDDVTLVLVELTSDYGQCGECSEDG